MIAPAPSRILVTGGAGYIGSVLVPRLLASDYTVRSFDVGFFGSESLAAARHYPKFEEVVADLRDDDALRRALVGIDAVIHLACLSNDPSCEIDADLTRAINRDAFEPLLRLAREAGVRRFLFASSSSIYGISDAPQVTEEHPMRPVSLYNQLKYECEQILFRYQTPDFTTVAIRPATVCGRSPRQRLDLTVNILTAHAVEEGVVRVFGGEQYRPNLHIDDMVDLYEWALAQPPPAIAGHAFNAGHFNLRVNQIAEIVRTIVAEQVPDCPPPRIETTVSNDPRSYRIDCTKLARAGFRPRRGIETAVRELTQALRRGEVPAALRDARYYNVKWMNHLCAAGAVGTV